MGLKRSKKRKAGVSTQEQERRAAQAGKRAYLVTGAYGELLKATYVPTLDGFKVERVQAEG